MAGPYAELLRLPVRTNGIEVARPVAALADAAGALVGFELRCGDGSRAFLPAAAAEIRPDEIHVSSPLVFLGEPELAWYRNQVEKEKVAAGY